MTNNLLTIPGYRIIEQIYNGSRTQVYRGISESNQKVIIKLLLSEYPTFSELVQFRNQYTIAKNLNLPGIIETYSLETYQNSYALVMEDFGGIPLNEWMEQGETAPTLREFLQVAIDLSNTLDILYRHRIIHKDIKPANILINPHTKHVKLIDFSIASLLPRETQTLMNPNVLEGTLGYLSPEQTGRMNRGIDYRTDFYSLGVTFYGLLAGQLPFQSNDAMELVHCHIAKQPPSLHEINPEIPPVLSEIVSKLMAKNAEDRYQSALGLKFDLEFCLKQLEENGKIESFTIAQRDVGDRFLIPEKLYGRETEVAELLAAFDRVAGFSQQPSEQGGGCELMLVAGFSGIGKTAIVNEVHKPIARQRGYFIKGKFDQFNRNIPFSAFVQAFRDLMGQLLTASDQQLKNWQTQILQAVGDNGQVIIEVIPELERIIGPQPPALELSGTAAQNRFDLLFQNFIHVFTKPEHPLVMFLDDLQWADSASLRLMQLLVTESASGYLLVIGAYRDNEVFAAHPLMLTLDAMAKAGATVNTLTLEPLSSESLNHLVADTLNCDPYWARPLADLAAQKTQGNPFFATQFLKALHQDGLIEFDRAAGYWQCDIVRVREAALTDDVVEFMALQLQKLPPATQNVLKLAACVGNQFDLGTLAVVSQQLETETAADLWKALQEGLILPESEIYKFYMGRERREETENSEVVNYKFLHDRVQQAAYSLIPEQERDRAHYQIGQLLRQQISPAAREEQIFSVVNQLNYGIALIEDQTERDDLAQLNLTACRKARAATAYQAAREYAEIGLNLLGESAWQRQYEMTLNLHDIAAEVASLSGDFDRMDRWIDTVIHHTKTPLERVNVYIVKIQALSSQNKFLEGIAIGLLSLKELGVELPDSATSEDIQQAVQEINSSIGDRPIEELFDLPGMVDAQKLATMQMAASMASTCYLVGSSLFALVTALQVNLSIQYGNSPTSAYSYSCYGMFLNNFLQDVTVADQFCRLAYRLGSSAEAKNIRSATFAAIGLCLYHRKSHLRETLPILQAGYQAGLETGNLEFVGHNGHGFCLNAYCCGQPLAELEPQIRAYRQQLLDLNQLTAANYCSIFWETTLFLLGNPNKFEISFEQEGDEEKLVSESLATNDFYRLCIFYLYRATLRFLLEDFAGADLDVDRARQYIVGGVGTTCEAVLYFYDSLIALATPESETQLETQRQRVEENQRKLQYWAEHAPMNYLHKWQLVEAEKYRVARQRVEAIEMYDRAISGAKENEYLNEEALAHELAAKFYLEWGKEKIATVYLTDAYYAYARWGALAKVADLEKRYPQLLAPILNQKNTIITSQTMARITAATITSSSYSISEALDLGTVMKASQALSGEIKLDKLLSILMQVVMENLGAEKCALILKKAGSLIIEATAISGTSETIVLQSISLETSNDLPHSIINYVARTQEYVIFNDLHNEIQNPKSPIQNLNDPYIIQHQPKSVLCLPIQHQGKAIGIFYLENNLATGAFTPDRLAVLKLLSSQAAISIENAQLYANLEAKVEERTQELSQALSNLEATQEGLIQSEKMAALGQLVAGVAHEVNTPLGAIRSSAGNVSKFLNQTLEQLPALFQSLSPEEAQNFLSLLQRSLQQEASLSTKEERKFKRALRSQLEELGIENGDTVADRLVLMGVYNEIDAFIPLLQISDSVHILEIAYKLSELKRGIATINAATDRASKVVFALKTYARYEQSGEKTAASITEGIETILTLYQNLLKQGVEVIKNYAEIPPILCYPDELNQVWTNLIHNALQAMDYRGTLTIELTAQDYQAKISITDSGHGIPEEIKTKIFDPFFTTKPTGEGSGLGLDIVKKIVDKHQGKIEVESIPGKTTFNIFLPMSAV